MHIHLFTNESFYSYELLKLFETSINLEDHLFVFRKKDIRNYSYSAGINARIIYSTHFLHLVWHILPEMKKAKWIYFHYLPYGPSLFLWFFLPGFISKSTWIIWGGDVFIYKQKNKSFKNRVYEFLRKTIIPHFPEIAAFVEDDAHEALKVYHSDAKYIPILYPIPVNLDHIKTLEMRPKENTINILIGNSADPSNNHLEILDDLSKFSKENIHIYCPLSYSNSPDYISTIIQKGKEVFKDNFTPITTLMQPSEYGIFLNTMDIAIMNHQRQQGLGNIIPLIYLGKKVFIRSDISTYPFLIKAGCVIFDTVSLNKSNFASFISIDDSSIESNKHAIEAIISPANYIQLWNNLFSKHQ